MDSNDEFNSICENWRQRVFAKGPISKSRLESSTVELVREWFLRDFQRFAAQRGGHGLAHAPDSGWWEGLDAFSAVFGRALVAGLSRHTPSKGLVDFDVWGRMIYANARASVGTLENGTELPSDWHEDPVFAAAWAIAVQNKFGDERLLKMFTLALHWDTFRIPLRYFTDGAANAFLSAAMSSRIEPDTYRKDIRGSRNGLGLEAPSGDQVLVKWDIEAPDTFRVNLKAATVLGLNPAKFSRTIPGTERSLLFEPH